MKSFKKYLTAAAVAAAMFTSTGAFADDTITLRLGFVDPASSSYAMGGQKFADECARLTDGKVQVKVLAGGTLGGEREMYEGAQMGTMDMVTVVNTVCHSSSLRWYCSISRSFSIPLSRLTLQLTANSVS